MHYTAQFGDIETIQLLLERDANPNAVNEHGFTPLITATCKKQVEIVKYLLSLDRVDITAKTSSNFDFLLPMLKWDDGYILRVFDEFPRVRSLLAKLEYFPS